MSIEQIEEIKEIYPIPIHLIKRKSKMGTLKAQIVGARYCTSEYVLVMDCDLQHPPSFIPDFIVELRGNPDVIVGSRYVKGGYNNWSAYRG
ncbi:MAG: glycosyltransferase [Thermoplasmatales archaeon]